MLRPLALLVIIVTLSGGGCSSKSSPDATGTANSGATTRTAIQLNWYAEAEHGGAYQAQADGLYKAAGLEVEIRPGGASTPVAAEVVLGRADFAITNADDVVHYRAAKSDIVAVLAAMQDNPRCIMVNQKSGVTSWEGLKGMTLQRQPEQGFIEFLRSKGVLEGVQEVPYHGSVANLVVDPKIAVQAYSFAEPFVAKGEGADVNVLMVSDLGWNPYSSVLVTRGELIRTNPELVAKVVKATRAGWQKYVTDPAAGNELILKANQHGMTAEALQFGSTSLVELARPDGMPVEEVGKMTAERWKSLVDQMIAIGSVKPDEVPHVKYEECFTLQFLE